MIVALCPSYPLCPEGGGGGGREANSCNSKGKSYVKSNSERQLISLSFSKQTEHSCVCRTEPADPQQPQSSAPPAQGAAFLQLILLFI